MVTEEEKEKALSVLEQYKAEQTHIIRDNLEYDCPSKDYLPIKKGEEQLGECMSDGHYMCRECKWLDLEHYNNIKGC